MDVTADDQDLGVFDPQAVAIEIWESGPDPDFTLLHEIGHFIDYTVLGVGNLAASATVRLREWRGAVRGSDAFQAIEGRYANPSVLVSGFAVTADIEDIDYYLRPDELFARSYAQYIVEKSSDQILGRQLARAPCLASSSEVLYAAQWEEADFGPIAATFDELLGGLGWSGS